MCSTDISLGNGLIWGAMNWMSFVKYNESIMGELEHEFEITCPETNKRYLVVSIWDSVREEHPIGGVLFGWEIKGIKMFELISYIYKGRSLDRKLELSVEQVGMISDDVSIEIKCELNRMSENMPSFERWQEMSYDC